MHIFTSMCSCLCVCCKSQLRLQLKLLHRETVRAIYCHKIFTANLLLSLKHSLNLYHAFVLGAHHKFQEFFMSFKWIYFFQHPILFYSVSLYLRTYYYFQPIWYLEITIFTTLFHDFFIRLFLFYFHCFATQSLA